MLNRRIWTLAEACCEPQWFSLAKQKGFGPVAEHPRDWHQDEFMEATPEDEFSLAISALLRERARAQAQVQVREDIGDVFNALAEQ